MISQRCVLLLSSVVFRHTVFHSLSNTSVWQFWTELWNMLSRPPCLSKRSVISTVDVTVTWRNTSYNLQNEPLSTKPNRDKMSIFSDDTSWRTQDKHYLLILLHTSCEVHWMKFRKQAKDASQLKGKLYDVLYKMHQKNREANALWLGTS
jgi:thioredoxin-related protein